MQKNNTNFVKSYADSNRHMLEKISHESIALTRATSYGGAGISLACILALHQSSNLPTAILVSVMAFSAAMPLFIFYAGINEIFLMIGEKSFSFYREVHCSKSFIMYLSATYVLFAVGIAAMVYDISVFAFISLSSLTIIGLIFINTIQYKLNKILDKAS